MVKLKPKTKRASPKATSGFDSFQEKLLTVLRPTIKKSEVKELAASIRRDLFGEETSVLNKTRASRDEALLIRMLQAFIEISDSLESLRNSEIYLRRFPFPKTRVTHVAYLRHQLESYIQELYILYNRCIKLVSILRRAYRNQESAFNQTFDIAEKVLKVSLDRLIKARGSHVHDRRFEDQDIRRVALLEFILLHLKLKKFQLAYKLGFQDARSKKVKWVKDTNKAVKELLDIFFKELEKVLFKPDGTFQFPKIHINNKNAK